MKLNIIPRSFSKDTILDEDINTIIPISASGDFTVRSINAIGPAVFRKNLLVNKNGSFHSLLTVNENCTVDEKLLIKGKAIIDGDLFAKELIINGNLEAANITTIIATIKGEVEVQGNLSAAEKITFEVTNKTKIVVYGTIEAPEVAFVNVKKSLGKRIMGLLSLNKQFQKIFKIDNQRIITERLILDKVEVEGDIKAGEIINL
ncbi:MAG: hypothetical protein ACTSYA_10870 [Candidatus Kariarchaeaceae archaeon]